MFAVQRDQKTTTSVVATWKKIPDDLINGILLGYKLRYTVSRISDELYIGAPITKEIKLDKFTFRYKITGLQSYTTYDISVAGYTDAGNGPFNLPIPESMLLFLVYVRCVVGVVNNFWIFRTTKII